jgi:hypothetical protein
VIPANFRRGARFAWRAMLEAASEDEQAALLESAGLLFEYVDRVSRIYSEGHALAAQATATSAEEIAAGALVPRIEAEESPLCEDQRLAERLGFALERAARPFVIALPHRSPERHAKLAAKLRQARCAGRVRGARGGRAVGGRGARSAATSSPSSGTWRTWRSPAASAACSTPTTTWPSCSCAARSASRPGSKPASTARSMAITPSSPAPSTS